MRAQRTWLIVAALAGLAAGRGCGFGPQDQFTGRRIGNGVAPYTDQGEVRICNGNDRVGIPSGMPGGFCGKGGAAATACTGDGDCKSRERCVCGLCTVQFCTANAECGVGWVCSFADNRCDRPCATRADCSAGESCINQSCRSGVCSSDAVCQGGERCGSATPRRCIVDPCDSDAACTLASSFCRIQRRPRTAREPTLLVDPTSARPYVMWLSLDEGPGTTAIHRADSADGLTFALSPTSPVLSPEAGDDGSVGAPSVVRGDSGVYEMYFEIGGKTIGRATSNDGKTWTRNPGAVLTPSGWEGTRVGAPAAGHASDGTILLFYEGGDGEGIGLATASPTASSFTRVGADGRVLRPSDVTDPVLWRAVDHIASPYVWVGPGPVGDTIRLWFAAHGIESSAANKLGTLVEIPPNFSIGYAAANYQRGQVPAFVPHPWNPVFDRVQGFLVHPSELAPAVVEAPEGEHFVLYYGRADEDGQTDYQNLGAAHNP